MLLLLLCTTSHPAQPRLVLLQFVYCTPITDAANLLFIHVISRWSINLFIVPFQTRNLAATVRLQPPFRPAVGSRHGRWRCSWSTPGPWSMCDVSDDRFISAEYGIGIHMPIDESSPAGGICLTRQSRIRGRTIHWDDGALTWICSISFTLPHHPLSHLSSSPPEFFPPELFSSHLDS